MNKVILVGKAASGKDYARKVLQERGFSYGVSFTSRPPREGEVDGVDYIFLSKEKFEEIISKDGWFEYVEFNGWYYGTSKLQWEVDNLFIFTPEAVNKLSKEDRQNCTIIYFDIPVEIRQERLASREMPGDSATRRIAADEADFIDFSDYDIRITNPNF